jgi:hypothetical protein
MMAGFLRLVFDPHAWAAVAVTALVAFSGGFLKGWNASNADHWRDVAHAAVKAASDKERLAREDASRAETAETALAASQAQLEGLLHDTKSSCRLSGPELDGLRQLAAGERRRK